MLFKKRSGDVRRCPNGHILDPSWETCPYCQEALDGTGEYLPSSEREREQPPPPPSGSEPPPGGWGAPPRPGQPARESQRPAPPPPSPPPLRPQPSPPPRALDDDVTVINQPRPGGPQAAPPPAGPPHQSPPPGAGQAPPHHLPPQTPGGPPGGPPRSDVTQVLGKPIGVQSVVGWVVVTTGNERGQDFRLPGGTVRVGTQADCELCFADDSYISGHHAEIAFREGVYRLRDLGSRNGTFVNDEPIREHVLQDGDRVRLGLTQLVFKCVQL